MSTAEKNAINATWVASAIGLLFLSLGFVGVGTFFYNPKSPIDGGLVFGCLALGLILTFGSAAIRFGLED